MKQKMLSRYKNCMIFVAVMLGSCLTFAAPQEEVQIRLSKVELQEIFNNPNHPYVYLLEQASDLAEVIDRISALDKDKESLVHGLNDHIKRGFAIAHYDAVAQTLQRAEKVLQEAQADLAADEYQSLKKSLEDVIELVIHDRLSLEADMLSFMKDTVDAQAVTRSNHCGLRLITVDEKFYFLSLVKFKNHVVFKDHVKFEDDVKFKDEVVFEDAVTIEGALSVAEQVIGCDLNVGCNILMTNSTDALHGNILKNGTQFIHNFGTQNTFMGAGSGNFTMSGTANTAVGAQALNTNTTGGQNTAMGVNALALNTLGDNNAAFGYNALAANTTGPNNSAFGSLAMSVNTTGQNNAAFGINALSSNTIGQNNSAFGAGSLVGNTTGQGNVGIGSLALLANATGSFNIGLGMAAGIAVTGDNNIAIANPGVAAEAGAIRIGTLGTHTTCFIQGINGVTSAGAVPVVINAAGQLGTVVSKRSAKKDIRSMGDMSARIYDLEPVVFVYKNDAANAPQVGLIADDVAHVLPELVQYDEDGNPATVYYQHLPVYNLNELKRLAARVAALEAYLECQE